jgi:hypothetical protein
MDCFYWTLTSKNSVQLLTFNRTKKNSKYSKIRTVRIKCKGHNFYGAPFVFASSELKRNVS